MCTNRRTIKRTKLEASVLGALRTRLMAPELYEAFVRGFTSEWNAEQKGRAVAQDRQRDELQGLDRKIGNFVDDIGKDASPAAIKAALKAAEARKAELEAELTLAEAPTLLARLKRHGGQRPKRLDIGDEPLADGGGVSTGMLVMPRAVSPCAGEHDRHDQNH